MQSLGLTTTYRDENSEEGKFLRLFFGLPFLDSCEVGDCFTDDFIPLKPEIAKITKFCDYVLETYIAEDCEFPPQRWAEYDSNITRTTNACESFNAKLNGMLYTAHPNIFRLIESLLEIQCEAYRSLENFGIRMLSRTELERFMVRNSTRKHSGLIFLIFKNCGQTYQRYFPYLICNYMSEVRLKT